jgi:hypothetical protein
MRLWGWRPSQSPPKFINSVSWTRPTKGNAFALIVTMAFCEAEFDVTCEIHEQFWGAPIVGPRRNKELGGLAGLVGDNGFYYR